MRLVLDTNVLIAAFVARGVCHEVLEHCEREHSLVSSAFILGEFEEKLTTKFGVPLAATREARTLNEAHMEIVTPEPLQEPVCRDPDDDWMLATARSGGCEAVVTGDKDLLVLAVWQEIAILSPSAFWRYELAHHRQR